MTSHRVKAKDLAKQPFALPTGQPHQVVVQPRELAVLDVEDSHFNFDRRVLLPDLNTTDGSVPTLDKRRITGLGVIFAALTHARKHPSQGVCVTGHTDASGAASYNQTLSQDRAQNVWLLLRGKREEWRKHAAAEDNVDDFQTVLTWQHQRSDWGCDPGPINNVNGVKTRIAIGTFQERYNEEVAVQAGKDTPFRSKITVDNKVGPETWGAFYDLYMTELIDLLDLDGFSQLEALQAALFTPPGMQDFVGCGEHIPFNIVRRNPFEKGTDEHLEGPQKNPPDRRVEILFFDPGEEVKQVCHPRKGKCVPAECPIYMKLPFKQNPIGIPKGLPLAEINLKLVFRDPEGKLRPFPAGLEVQARFGDPAADAGGDRDLLTPFDDDGADAAGSSTGGSDSEGESMAVDQEPTETTTAGGLLRFIVARRGPSLFLKLMPDDRSFITADPRNLDDQKLATEAEALADIAKGRVFFRLPRTFTSQEGYFKLAPETSPPVKFDDGRFRDVNNRETQIGSREAPVELRLEIRWQFFKFTYFDRFTSSPTTVPQSSPGPGAAPPLVMLGFPIVTGPDNNPQSPPARTAWHVATGKQTVHALAWVLRVITASKPPRPLPDSNCMVRFSFTDAVFVRTEGDGKTQDAERRLVTFAAGDHTPDTPSADRLRLYDLPVDWWSTDYPVQLEGETIDKLRPFQKAAATASTLTKPYVVSLDIIVLCHNAVSPAPDSAILWDDTKIEHRFAIYDHQLQVYKPETARKESYFTKLGALSRPPDGPVLYDVPPFTRLITRGRSLYPVFDERTLRQASFKGAPVGARMALAATVPGQNGFVQGGNALSTVVAPYRAPRQDAAVLGESACALLRCCGRDGNVELFFIVQYLTASFNFAPPAFKNAPLMTNPPTGDGATDKAADCLDKVRKRWNGEDGFHKDQVVFQLGSPETARGRWRMLLARGAPGGANAAILDIHVYEKMRSHMNGTIGRWEHDDLDVAEEGQFAGAHEIGHSLGLPDEYLDTDDEPSIHQPNLRERGRGRGTPYSTDTAAMMKGNVHPRARYFWHLVLSWRDRNLLAVNGNDILIKHGPHQFTTALTPRAQDRTRFPTVSRTAAQVAAAAGPRAFCEPFVYVSGHDGFFDGAIDSTAAGSPFDGLINVRVKMAWDVTTTNDYDELKAFLARATEVIRTRFNDERKLVARGKLGTSNVRLRVLFSPRYVLRTFPHGGDTQKYLDSIDNPPLAKKDATSYNARVQTSETRFGIHAVVTVAADGTPGVVANPVPGPRSAVVRQDGSFLLIFTRPHFTDDVLRVFGQLVGLADGQIHRADDFKPLLDSLAPDLVVTHREFL